MKEKHIAVRIGKHGYSRVSLMVNRKRKTFYVHRLVAIAFIPNPKGKREVNHINGIKADNRLENLEWCTSLENLQHAFVNGLRVMPRGNEHWKVKEAKNKA